MELEREILHFSFDVVHSERDVLFAESSEQLPRVDDALVLET